MSLETLMQLKTRQAQRRDECIAAGVLPDPNRPGLLEDAAKLVGTCMDMCPEYERVEREVQKELDRWEVVPGTTHADPTAAVKIYRRPAAGRELPLPEDVRPPAVLEKTLNYLFHTLLPSDPRDPLFAAVQPFLWNRTRAIRQDFIVQSDRGWTAIACHERIARYHILCLHWKGGVGADAWSEQQELEQLRKTLRSLIEYYDDQRLLGHTYPNEAEFRAYNLLLHARDPEALREVELLPCDVFSAPLLQTALHLRTLIQRSNMLEKRGQSRNTESTPNMFTRFFRDVARPDVSYLMACLAENLFSSVRVGALKALSPAYLDRHHGLPLAYVVRMLGMDSEDEASAFLTLVGIEIDSGAAKINRAARINEDQSLPAPFSALVERKRGDASCQAIIDRGLPTHAHMQAAPPPATRRLLSDAAPKAPAPPRAQAPALPHAQAPTPVALPRATPTPPAPAQVPPQPRPAAAQWPPPPPPAEPRRPRVPRARLAQLLAARVCAVGTQESVERAAHTALEHERRRRARALRTRLIDALTARLTASLAEEPVAQCVHNAAYDAAATQQYKRAALRRAWRHWLAVLAKQRDRAAQAARLEAIRAQLPRSSVVRGARRSSSGASCLRDVRSDALRRHAFVDAQTSSSRLWGAGTLADELEAHVEELAWVDPPPPPTWTVAVYAGKGAGARWLRHKFAITTSDYIAAIGGTRLCIVDAARSPAAAAHAAFVVCKAGTPVPPPASAPVPPPALLVIAWTPAAADAALAALGDAWLHVGALVLDDPQADPDALFHEMLERLVPMLRNETEAHPLPRAALMPLWDTWCDIARAADEIVAGAPPSIASDALVVLTSLANLLLRQVAAAAGTHVMTLPAVRSEHDTPAALALQQLDAWSDSSGDRDGAAVALLRARVAEAPAFHVGDYLQTLLWLALESMPDVQPVPPGDVVQLRQLGAQAIDELAARRASVSGPHGPLSHSPDKHPDAQTSPVSGQKRPCAPPEGAAKRHETDPSVRLAELMARTARLLRAPRA